MAKYEKMVEFNKEKNAKKVKLAIESMRILYEDNRQVYVSELVRMTGFCRAFFYTNETVNNEYNRYKELQKDINFAFRRKVFLEQAIQQRIKQVEKENVALQILVAEKDKEILSLKRKLARRTEGMMKDYINYL